MVSQGKKKDELTWQDLQDHALWWVKLGYRSFRYLTTFWQRHFKLTVLSMGGFAVLMTGLLYLEAQQYQVTTTFVYTELHPKIFGDMADKLNATIKTESTQRVAELLHLSVEDAGKIKGVVVSDNRGKPLSNNYSTRKEPMLVTIKLAAPLPEDSLRQAISQYFNDNPFTADRLELKKRQLNEELAYIDVKLQTIDSILTTLYARPTLPGSEQGSITIENAEGKNAYELLNFSRELLQRKSEIENTLVNPETVFPIDNFIILPEARFNAPAIVFKGLMGVVIGYFFAAFVGFWRDKLQPVVRS